MEIRKSKEIEKPAAMELAWPVFREFEAPEYSPEGIRTFRGYITDSAAVSTLTAYGAFDGERVIGVLAIREGGTHISLFFVDPTWHQRGIGRALFRRFLDESPAGRVAVNASPYAVEIYHHLGFRTKASEQITDGVRYTPMEYIRETSL